MLEIESQQKKIGSEKKGETKQYLEFKKKKKLTFCVCQKQAIFKLVLCLVFLKKSNQTNIQNVKLKNCFGVQKVKFN